MNAITPSIFESFNARALSPEAVAKTFIPSPRFSELATRCHSIVIGPRGSGKTSLLKMLQTTALENWKHNDAQSYRARIDYSSVFIATDSAWKDQLENVGFGHLTQSDREQLCLAAFTTHFFHSLLTAFVNRMDAFHPGDLRPKHRRVHLDQENETYLVKELAKESKLSPTVNSLLSLKHAARARIGNIWKYAMDEKNLPKESRAERFSKIEFLNFHFLHLCSLAIEMFNDLVGDKEARWALLFDELELAPDFILKQLLLSLRSFGDQKILIKMSMSPYSADLDTFRSLFRATSGQDYNEICLWYAHKEDGYEFSRCLVQGLLNEHGIATEKLEDIFGVSPFEENVKNAYAFNSLQYKTFKNSLGSDSSFRKYFQDASLRLEDVPLLRDSRKATIIRKIFPTLLLREFFRVDERPGTSQRQSKRSRKNPWIYGGATGLLAVAEGNPRWLIGIFRQLIPSARNGMKIPRSVQTEEILKAAHRFRALLKIIPAIGSSSTQNPRSVLSVLDKVGVFFNKSVVLSDFEPQPYGSFTVDSNCSDNLIQTLGLALNAGAIVFVPDAKGDILLSSLKGKRFRIAYLLSPHYEIPIRLGDSVSLDRILSNPNFNPQQQTLI
jgi:hypothetical protein